MTWDKCYRAWLDECLAEYNARFQDRRAYHQESAPTDYTTGLLVEFAEDGTAYPHGIGGTNYIPGAVTPWEDSPHYCH